MNTWLGGFLDLIQSKLGRVENPLPFQEPRGAVAGMRSRLKGVAVRAAHRAHFYWIERPERRFRELAAISARCAEFEALHDSLADEASRKLLLEVLALRVLGPYYVKSPVATEEYWETAERIETQNLVRPATINMEGYPLCSEYQLDGNHRKIRLNASHFGIMTTFITDQYSYRSGDAEIRVKSGDVVVDGGGFLGETAIRFGDLMDGTGRIFVFEFNPTTLPRLQENLDMNREITGIARVITHALWNESGVRLGYIAHGPGTAVGKDGAGAGTSDAITTLSIDDCLEREKAPRVDFIKLDVEGAELAALQGARKAIVRDKPSLAVALYHNINDFIEIPKYLASLGLGYRFYLKHAYVDDTETVLFAHVPGRSIR